MKGIIYIEKYIVGDNLFQDFAYSQIEVDTVYKTGISYVWENKKPKGVLLVKIKEYPSGYRRYFWALYYTFISKMEQSNGYDSMRSYYNFKKKYFKYLKPKQRKGIEELEYEINK